MLWADAVITFLGVHITRIKTDYKGFKIRAKSKLAAAAHYRQSPRDEEKGISVDNAPAPHRPPPLLRELLVLPYLGGKNGSAVIRPSTKL